MAEHADSSLKPSEDPLSRRELYVNSSGQIMYFARSYVIKKINLF
jgi:hypothetical protein